MKYSCRKILTGKRLARSTTTTLTQTNFDAFRAVRKCLPRAVGVKCPEMLIYFSKSGGKELFSASEYEGHTSRRRRCGSATCRPGFRERSTCCDAAPWTKRRQRLKAAAPAIAKCLEPRRTSFEPNAQGETRSQKSTTSRNCIASIHAKESSGMKSTNDLER